MINIKLILNFLSGLFSLIMFVVNAQYNIIFHKSFKTTLYWFDVGTNKFLLYGESTNCDHSNSNPCAFGYYNVSDPSNPQKPNKSPDKIETGERP